jgi:hypothetical protein
MVLWREADRILLSVRRFAVPRCIELFKDFRRHSSRIIKRHATEK